MSCHHCKDEKSEGYKTDFGAFVQAYRSTWDKPDLRQKVIQKARQLFLVKNVKEIPWAATEKFRRP